MSDHDPRLDELLSAHLDGETSPAEAARLQDDLARDPALQARFDELATARQASRDAMRSDITSLDDAARETMLQRVFAELDAESGDAPQQQARPTTLTPVSQLSTRRRDPSRLLAAAAAVVAVVLLGGAITMLGRESGGSGSEDSAATGPSADAAESAGSSPADGGADDGSALSIEPGAQLAAAAQGDLGSFVDANQLRDNVRQNVLHRAAADAEANAPGREPTSSAPPDTDSSTNFACAAPPGATSVYTAELADRPVFVVHTGDIAIVIDQQTCTEVLRITPQ